MPWFLPLSRFVDEIQEQVDGVEDETSIVKDLYDLIDTYQVPVSPQDLAVYQVRRDHQPECSNCITLPSPPLPPSPQSLRPEVMRLRSAVDKAVSDRETYVNKFCNNLDRDIVELGKDLKEVKTQAQVNPPDYLPGSGVK